MQLLLIILVALIFALGKWSGARPLQKRTGRNISRWGRSVDDDSDDDNGEGGQDDATDCGVGEGNDEHTITMRRAMLAALIMGTMAILRGGVKMGLRGRC